MNLVRHSRRTAQAEEEAPVQNLVQAVRHRFRPFGSEAAVRYARIAADRRRLDRPIDVVDPWDEDE